MLCTALLNVIHKYYAELQDSFIILGSGRLEQIGHSGQLCSIGRGSEDGVIACTLYLSYYKTLINRMLTHC